MDAKPANLNTAIDELRAELAAAASDSDSLDQKALLIPSFTVALVAFVLAPPANPSNLEVILILEAVFLSALTVVAGFATLRPTGTRLGPNASLLAESLALEPEDFDLRIVGSLVKAVNFQTDAKIGRAHV